jgi:hypothetical protein
MHNNDIVLYLHTYSVTYLFLLLNSSDSAASLRFTESNVMMLPNVGDSSNINVYRPRSTVPTDHCVCMSKDKHTNNRGQHIASRAESRLTSGFQVSGWKSDMDKHKRVFGYKTYVGNKINESDSAQFWRFIYLKAPIGCKHLYTWGFVWILFRKAYDTMIPAALKG